jgi:hypothetical protein
MNCGLIEEDLDERALPWLLLLRPTCGSSPPRQSAARVGRHAFPACLAALRPTLLAAFTAERAESRAHGWVELATRCHGGCDSSTSAAPACQASRPSRIIFNDPRTGRGRQ